MLGEAKGEGGGNLDAGDTGRKSSVPKGTVGGNRSAQDRSRADRKGISVKQAKASGSAQRSAVGRMKKKSPQAGFKVNFRRKVGA